MTHSTLCFLCKSIESDPGEMCQDCDDHIAFLRSQLEFDFSPVRPSPMRTWVNEIFAPMFGASI